MKTNLMNYFIIATLLLGIAACNQEEKKQDSSKISTDVINVPATASGITAQVGSAPVMTFNEDRHDFGRITQGEKVSHAFIFKNTGGSELVISSAQGSCGCTVPTYPKEPIKAGQEAKIDVVFDSDGKSGLMEKIITLVTNCNPSTKVLTISSTIIVPEEK